MTNRRPPNLPKREKKPVDDSFSPYFTAIAKEGSSATPTPTNPPTAPSTTPPVTTPTAQPTTPSTTPPVTTPTAPDVDEVESEMPTTEDSEETYSLDNYINDQTEKINNNYTAETDIYNDQYESALADIEANEKAQEQQNYVNYRRLIERYLPEYLGSRGLRDAGSLSQAYIDAENNYLSRAGTISQNAEKSKRDAEGQHNLNMYNAIDKRDKGLSELDKLRYESEEKEEEEKESEYKANMTAIAETGDAEALNNYYLSLPPEWRKKLSDHYQTALTLQSNAATNHEISSAKGLIESYIESGNIAGLNEFWDKLSPGIQNKLKDFYDAAISTIGKTERDEEIETGRDNIEKYLESGNIDGLKGYWDKLSPEIQSELQRYYDFAVETMEFVNATADAEGLAAYLQEAGYESVESFEEDYSEELKVLEENYPSLYEDIMKYLDYIRDSDEYELAGLEGELHSYGDANGYPITYQKDDNGMPIYKDKNGTEWKPESKVTTGEVVEAMHNATEDTIYWFRDGFYVKRDGVVYAFKKQQQKQQQNIETDEPLIQQALSAAQNAVYEIFTGNFWRPDDPLEKMRR